MLPVTVKRNRYVCLALEFLWTLYLGTSFINVYFNAYGLNQSQIFGLQVVLIVMMIFADLPLGYAADRFGLRRVIVAGTVLQVLQTVYFLTCTSFWQFAVYYVLNGLTLSALSNTTSTVMTRAVAIIEDNAVRKMAYITYEKHRVDVRNLGFLTSAIVGGYLVAIGTITWPFLVQPAIFAAGVIVSLGLTHLPRQNGVRRRMRTSVSRVVRNMLGNQPDVRCVILLSTIVQMGGFACLWLFQPRMQLTGMPVWAFALVYMGWSVAAIALRRLDFTKWFDAYWMWAALAFCLPVGALVAAFTTGYLGLAVLVAMHAFMSVFSQAMILTYLYSVLPDDYETRTTELSVVTTVESLSFIVIGPITGWLKDTYSLSAAFFMIAAIGICLGVPALWVCRKYVR